MHGYSDTPFLGSIGKQVLSIEIFVRLLSIFCFLKEKKYIQWMKKLLRRYIIAVLSFK